MELLRTIARRVRARLPPILARRRTETELDEELRFHLDAEIRERVRRGVSPDAALATAPRDFSGVARFKDECRDAWGNRILDETIRDARYALHALRRAPAFTAVAVLTIALGIGAATTIFSVVRGVLRPLPHDAPTLSSPCTLFIAGRMT